MGVLPCISFIGMLGIPKHFSPNHQWNICWKSASRRELSKEKSPKPWMMFVYPGPYSVVSFHFSFWQLFTCWARSSRVLAFDKFQDARPYYDHDHIMHPSGKRCLRVTGNSCLRASCLHSCVRCDCGHWNFVAMGFGCGDSPKGPKGPKASKGSLGLLDDFAWEETVFVAVSVGICHYAGWWWTHTSHCMGIFTIAETACKSSFPKAWPSIPGQTQRRWIFGMRHRLFSGRWWNHKPFWTNIHCGLDSLTSKWTGKKWVLVELPWATGELETRLPSKYRFSSWSVHVEITRLVEQIPTF